MKVAIDSNCRYVTRSGNTRYLEGLAGGLGSVGGVSISPLAWRIENFGYAQPERMLKTIYREIVWPRLTAPRQLSSLGVDLLHSPTGVLFDPGPAFPHVTTIHDFSVFVWPERYRRWHRHSALVQLRRASRLRHIITVSRFTADEAMRHMGVPAKCLFPVLHGCDFSNASPESEPAGFVVPAEFFLFVGNLEPGKNLTLLREAYSLATAGGHRMPPLVVVGARWHGVSREGTWPMDWIPAGRVSDPELVFLYRRAKALLFPSLYEGFGFPPLEAMTLGCPVVCSRVSSIPEVVGDAALSVPMDPQSYLKAALRINVDSNLADDLRQRGRERASAFSWEKCAKETMDVYGAALHAKS